MYGTVLAVRWQDALQFTKLLLGDVTEWTYRGRATNTRRRMGRYVLYVAFYRIL